MRRRRRHSSYRNRPRWGRHSRWTSRSRPWRRNSAPVWGGPLYRRNLLPPERREELFDLSPGNFRPPTLEVTKKYIEDWRDAGIKTPDDFALYQFDDIARERLDSGQVSYTSPRIERAQEQNRMDEALWRRQKFYDDNETAIALWQFDPEKHKFPELSSPIGDKTSDFRDVGDYLEVSEDQAYHYLYQFLHRNAQRDASDRDDVRQPPWKWRYREAVLTVGPEKASNLVKRVFEREGKRAPKWYLPENLYDDLGELFPEVEAAGEAEAAAEAARSRRLHRFNPWLPKKGGPWARQVLRLARKHGLRKTGNVTEEVIGLVFTNSSDAQEFLDELKDSPRLKAHATKIVPGPPARITVRRTMPNQGICLCRGCTNETATRGLCFFCQEAGCKPKGAFRTKIPGSCLARGFQGLH